MAAAAVVGGCNLLTNANVASAIQVAVVDLRRRAVLRSSTARQERVSMLQSSIYAVEVCYSNPKNLRHQLERRCTPVSRSPWPVGVSVPSEVSETVSGASRVAGVACNASS